MFCSSFSCCNFRKFRRIYHFCNKYFVAVPVLVFVCLEFLAYEILPLSWSGLLNTPGDRNLLKILLVGDPQLIGYRNTKVGAIERFDCDSYLKKTFTKAFYHVQPDLVIFLGDIFDEGLQSLSESDTQPYFERFDDIYGVRRYSQVIVVPGDNDVGGEEDDFSVISAKEFYKIFNTSQLLVEKNKMADFIHVDILSLDYNKSYRRKNGRISTVISHIPFETSGEMFKRKVLKDLSPQIIFSAHMHKSVHVVTDKRTNKKRRTKAFCFSGEILDLPISDDTVHEILVPSVSYRMGQADMGFGVAYINNSTRTLTYTVMWLPRRLYHLKVYLYVLIMTILVYSIPCLSCLLKTILIRQQRNCNL